MATPAATDMSKYSPKMRALLDRVIQHAKAKTPSLKARPWTPEDDAFLRNSIGHMSEADLAKKLDRTVAAVHLRWKRDLCLESPSKRADVLTSLAAAKLLGIDGHKMANWVDVGLIKGRYMAGPRQIRLIDRKVFMCWVCTPDNWVYFNPKNVRDAKIKRFLEMRAKRWGDEWWNSRQVADYHGVYTEDVKRYIANGWLKSFRLPYSLGGRHQNRKWSNHFILRSDAMAIRFFKVGERHSKFTPRADAWLLKARDELHMTFIEIGRMMKIGKVKVSKYGGGTNSTIAYRYHQLKAAMGVPKKPRKKGGKK